MARQQSIEDGKFPRVNTRITAESQDRLNYACEVRSKTEPRNCTQGIILIDLIMEHLPPRLDVGVPPRKTPKSIRRGRPPKTGEEKALSA
jgi:hypothetical protein